ncbi:hypothetical protein Taro_019262, partial [Colocasia esculenta]|nr:hypothetical protein [Colocasia esculenta]
MVRGARSGSSSGRRSNRGRGLFATSASGSSSVPPPVAAGSGEFTPPPPRVPGSGEFTPPYPRVPGPLPEDTVSLQEGRGSFYDNTLREVWINGDKIEPAQASQFITRTIQTHFPGPIHRFNDFPMKVQKSLYQMFMEKCKESLSECRPDSLEGARTDMDEERLLGKFVQHMGCREMATNLHNNESESGDQSRGQHAYKWEKELKRHLTFQEVFDKTHKKKGMDQYISERAREVAESYSQQMTEKYVGEEEQPQLDPEVWVAASGAPKKGHVHGFGHSMDTSRVLSGALSSTSHTSAFTIAGAPGTSPSEMTGFIRDEISSLESRLAQTMESHIVHTIQTQVSDAVQAQLSQALPQAISQALS